MAKWGIDFDSTLNGFDSSMLYELNRKFGTNYQLCDIKHWEFLREALTREQVNYLWGSEVYWNRAWTVERLFPIPFVVEGIERLKAAGHELTVITDRHKDMKPWVEEWLEFQGLRMPVVISNRYDYPKVDVAWDLGIEFFIDDAPHHIESMTNQPHLKQVYVLDRPYNQNVVAGGNVKRIKTWNEVAA